MNNDELLKRISSLEDRIKELESLKKDNLSMFGRSYSLVGNSNSDFLIKTKGLVKVQWGAKFIDIIKDGKINVDASFIFKVKDTNSIGIKDGIYVLDDDSVYIRIGGSEPINLVGEIGNTFVSFLGQQETNSEQKYSALTNIGFLYKDLSLVNENSLKNGIIYIESELKLYIVKDGELASFTVDFPNPFTLQFIIAKADNSKGALLIKGLGINNSIAFENLFIYNEFGNSYIDSNESIYFRIMKNDKLVINDEGITFIDPAILRYSLSEDDNSSKLASTEWVNKKLSSLNVEIDLTIREDEENIDIEKYFSKPEILLLLLDLEVGTTVAYLGQFGVITIAKSERDYTFSAVVRAITDGLKWSHRSINGTYDSLTGTWYGTSTYIIKDLFNPGYYWAKELKDSKPISPEYIGTTNTEVVSETIPYILYTNDGKVWKLVDKYITPDPDFVYFSASGSAACNLQNAQTVPMGFIGIVKSDGTDLVNVGRSNYAVSTFDKDDPTTGDIRGQIPKATRALLINTLKDALPGIIPSIPGLPVSFYIKKSDISTIPENSIHKLKSSEGGLSPTTIFLDAKVYVRNTIQSICRWTNSEGLKYNTTHPGTYKSVGDIDFWRNDLNIRILAGAVLCEIFQSVPNISAKEVRDAVYSDSVGFALVWTATHWENFDFFLMSGVCESSFAAPTDDESDAKAGLRMDNSINIICDATHIYGEFHVTYRDYRWPESPDPNYPYLSAVWAIDDKTKINEAYRLPYPVEIDLNLVFNGMDESYKITGTVGGIIAITKI